jgi:hypothetical protein
MLHGVTGRACSHTLAPPARAAFCVNFVLVFCLRLTWLTVLTFVICNLQIHKDGYEFDSHSRLQHSQATKG